MNDKAQPSYGVASRSSQCSHPVRLSARSVPGLAAVAIGKSVGMVSAEITYSSNGLVLTTPASIARKLRADAGGARLPNRHRQAVCHRAERPLSPYRRGDIAALGAMAGHVALELARPLPPCEPDAELRSTAGAGSRADPAGAEHRLIAGSFSARILTVGQTESRNWTGERPGAPRGNRGRCTGR
jgi:hypothetical protein